MFRIIYVAIIIVLLLACNSFAFNDPNNLFKIEFPKGWKIEKGTTSYEGKYVQAIHPSAAGTIAVHTFKSNDDKTKILNAPPSDYAKGVLLPLLRKGCPPAELLDSRIATNGTAKGIEGFMKCGSYYYKNTHYFIGDNVYQVLSTFIYNDKIMADIKKSSASLKILVPGDLSFKNGR